jgi:hypothetical protein
MARRSRQQSEEAGAGHAVTLALSAPSLVALSGMWR